MPTEVIIEIQAGSFLKTEIKENKLILDRVLEIPVPENYGFIPDTLASDGDPLDAFVIGPPVRPTEIRTAKLIGAFICEDNGILDEKIVLTTSKKCWTLEYRVISIQWFLQSYKPGFVVKKWVGPKEAANLIKKYTVKKAQRKITLKDIHPI